MNIEAWQNVHFEPIDLEDAAEVEILIREDGKTLWINAPTCIVRFCRIKGGIKINDNRKKKRNGKK